MYQDSALQEFRFFSAQDHHEEQWRQGEHAPAAAARRLFRAICPLGTGCIKLIAHIVQLGNLFFIPLDKLLMKILNTNCQGQTPVEVLDGCFHSDNESLITSLSFPCFLHTLNGNFSSMIFPLLIYKNII